MTEIKRWRYGECLGFGNVD